YGISQCIRRATRIAAHACRACRLQYGLFVPRSRTHWQSPDDREREFTDAWPAPGPERASAPTRSGGLHTPAASVLFVSPGRWLASGPDAASRSPGPPPGDRHRASRSPAGATVRSVHGARGIGGPTAHRAVFESRSEPVVAVGSSLSYG